MKTVNPILHSILIFFLFATMSGCTFGKISYGSYIEKNSSLLKNEAKVQYHSPAAIEREIKSKASINQWDSVRVAKEISENKKKYPGGYIEITIFSATIEGGNTKYWECVITRKDGTELLREKGSDTIAELPSTPGGLWWNISVVTLPEMPVDFFYCHIIDTLTNVRYDFTVYPDRLNSYKPN